MAKAILALWFVGLHETLAGSVIDTLLRTRPSWFPPGRQCWKLSTDASASDRHARSVFGRPLHSIDHQHVDGTSLRIEFQTELFLHRGEDRRTIRINGRHE
jgi:hypothetical protein